MEFRKMVTITLYARHQRDTDILNSLLDSVGEGEGGMIWESGIETCIISYKSQLLSLLSNAQGELYYLMQTIFSQPQRI